jgi:hypothetical protein
MKPLITIGLSQGTRPAPDLIAELPADLRGYQAGWELVVPMSEVAAARAIVACADARGWVAQVSGAVQWESADAGAGRPVILSLPQGPSCDETDFASVITCPECGQQRVTLAAPHRLDVRGHRPSRRTPAAMVSRSGMAVLLTTAAAVELDSAGLLRGGRLLPVWGGGAEVPGLKALIGTADLGGFIDDQFAGYCPNCGAPTGGGGFLRMYARPATDADVYATSWFGPTVPLVSERLARAMDRLNGLPADRQLSYYGWWPADQGLSWLPDLTAPPTPDELRTRHAGDIRTQGKDN